MKLKEVLEKQLERVKLDDKEYRRILDKTNEIIKIIKNKGAEIFVGGSLAKATLIKKEKYDIDIYMRFKDEKEAAKIENILKKSRLKAKKIHGSRDYFQIYDKELVFEIIPVLKISSPEDAKNVTDLSWFHVKYVKDKLKNNKLADEIVLGKSFTYASGCYGAESYIRGFSGYALELLIIYYKSFEKFLREMIKGKERAVIDPAHFYKNKQDILMSINEAKLSPIVYVDPTFKERNALAALSEETFERFKKTAGKFLANPSLKYFKTKRIDEKKFKIKIEIKTDRQEGDIAGTKLKKFYEMFSLELDRFFKIKNKEFEYKDGKKAFIYFNLGKKNIILKGPPINKVENAVNFKKAHKSVFIKQNIVYAKEKAISFGKFIQKFKKDNKKKMKEMGIVKLS